MAKRTRTKKLEIYVSDEEFQIITEKMAQLEIVNLSSYARKMLIDGFVVKKDFSELKILSKELANLSRNINQITKRVNETKSIYIQDVEDIRKYYYQVKRKVSEHLMKMIRQEER